MRWIAIVFGLALSAASSLLWHFAAPLAPFDPAATSGESGSISILGYALIFTEQGPPWLPSSLVIGALTLCGVAAAAWMRRSRQSLFWWPLPTSVFLGGLLWAVATVNPPQASGIAMVHPDSMTARMSNSPLFRESSLVFLVECQTASIVIGAVFAAIQYTADRRRR
ncbi:hypothetical protein CH256_14915 [Rhodococcus sp. 05-2254-6]|uniref:hypothetical protein n=1 Tax=Rhodococcus sp. 05-2254-6 TaxID=2022489 RepID=UPI000B9C69AF|nr:hypothetical protein [Rhodococcus sp. 05-2254-6]OZE30385.1 hypothetical protein CH256_14915 [Rhodococcus sp. 05-2254-6]